MSQNPNLLSLSHLEDACGHLFFLKLVFQTSHFPCLCIKKNRWWKPQGNKANKMQPPHFQHSRGYHLICIGPRMAFKWGTSVLHLVRHIQGVQQSTMWLLKERGAGIYFWTLSSSAHHLGHFHANCVFPPQRKVLTVLYLTKYPVLWFIRPFLPAWHSTKKPFHYPELLNLSLPGTPRSSSGYINFGRIPPRQLHGKASMELLHKGHFKTDFLNEIKLCFSFPFSLSLFFFSAFLSFYVCIYSYKSLDLGIDQTDLLVH